MPELRSLCAVLTPPVGGRGAARIALAAAAWLALLGTAAARDAAASASAAAVADRARVSSIVAGIVGYTRWPSDATAIRFCTLGQGRGVDELLGVADLGPTPLSVPVRAAASIADAWTDCDAIYVGRLAGNGPRELLQRTLGRPVLMIGEGADFFSDGGMFCLQPDTAAVKFTVNLDAVARSGLRVNPWVLRMARNAPGSRP